MRVAKPINSKSAARLERFARQHRSCLAESEARLWSALNASQLGVGFRRQSPIGARFTADFYAPSIKLIVEVDGGYHAHRRAADASRDRKLGRLGYRVVRVSAELALRDLSAAVALVREAGDGRDTPERSSNSNSIFEVREAGDGRDTAERSSNSNSIFESREACDSAQIIAVHARRRAWTRA